MATVVKAPGKYTKDKFTIFLGGVIDMDKAPRWNKDVVEALKEFDVLLLDPRRDNWDSTWEQTKEHPEFSGQVKWEWKGQEDADLCLYVFAPDAVSAPDCEAPITLLEYGSFATTKDCLICCPEGYYRKGNVDIVAEINGTPVYEDLQDLLADLKEYLKETA
jgi:hypothetical protein